MRIVLITILVLLFVSPAWAASWDIETNRGTQRINEGDILKCNSMTSGQVKGAKDITFYRWHFARETLEPVFVDCSDITLIKCNLVNVIIPDDGSVSVVDCLTLRKKRVGDEEITDTEDGDRYIEVVEMVEGIEVKVSERIERTPTNEKFTVIDARTADITAGPGYLDI